MSQNGRPVPPPFASMGDTAGGTRNASSVFSRVKINGIMARILASRSPNEAVARHSSDQL
jgi:hypothetical protein